MIAQRTCRTVSSPILFRFAAHTGNQAKWPSRIRRTGCGASEHGGERQILARTGACADIDSPLLAGRMRLA